MSEPLPISTFNLLNGLTVVTSTRIWLQQNKDTHPYTTYHRIMSYNPHCDLFNNEVVS